MRRKRRNLEKKEEERKKITEVKINEKVLKIKSEFKERC